MPTKFAPGVAFPSSAVPLYDSAGYPIDYCMLNDCPGCPRCALDSDSLPILENDPLTDPDAAFELAVYHLELAHRLAVEAGAKIGRTVAPLTFSDVWEKIS